MTQSWDLTISSWCCAEQCYTGVACIPSLGTCSCVTVSQWHAELPQAWPAAGGAAWACIGQPDGTTCCRCCCPGPAAAAAAAAGAAGAAAAAARCCWAAALRSMLCRISCATTRKKLQGSRPGAARRACAERAGHKHGCGCGGDRQARGSATEAAWQLQPALPIKAAQRSLRPPHAHRHASCAATCGGGAPCVPEVGVQPLAGVGIHLWYRRQRCTREPQGSSGGACWLAGGAAARAAGRRAGCSSQAAGTRWDTAGGRVGHARPLCLFLSGQPAGMPPVMGFAPTHYPVARGPPTCIHVHHPALRRRLGAVVWGMAPREGGVACGRNTAPGRRVCLAVCRAAGGGARGSSWQRYLAPTVPGPRPPPKPSRPKPAAAPPPVSCRSQPASSAILTLPLRVERRAPKALHKKLEVVAYGGLLGGVRKHGAAGEGGVEACGVTACRQPAWGVRPPRRPP